MNVNKIVISKGKTVEINKKWERIDYTVEVTLSENDDPEMAKSMANMLLDSWLNNKPVQKAVPPKPVPPKKESKASRLGYTKKCACGVLIADSYIRCYECNLKRKNNG